jgi:hypothetical protein
LWGSEFLQKRHLPEYELGIVTNAGFLQQRQKFVLKRTLPMMAGLVLDVFEDSYRLEALTLKAA